MDLVKQLEQKPEIGLGIAIAVGLALGTGALGALIPIGRRPPAPPPAATPTPSGPPARPATSDVAIGLNSLAVPQ